MKQFEVTMAGFGGQGIMVAGQLLSYAGLKEGKNVVWIPSYGPEMRGGTAYCTVVLVQRADWFSDYQQPDGRLRVQPPVVRQVFS